MFQVTKVVLTDHENRQKRDTTVIVATQTAFSVAGDSNTVTGETATQPHPIARLPRPPRRQLARPATRLKIGIGSIVNGHKRVFSDVVHRAPKHAHQPILLREGILV